MKLLKLFMLVLLVACCSKKKFVFAVGGAPNEVKFWEELVKEFEEETGINVEILRQPIDTDQRRQNLSVALKAKRPDPDVFLMDIAWLAQFDKSGWLEPLEKKKNGISTKDFFGTYKDNFVALPVYVDGGLLYYRKDMIEKPPETWDELVKIAIEVQRKERRGNPNFYGFVWQGAQYEGLVCNFLEFASSFGGGITIKGEKLFINTPENLKALKFMHDLIHEFKVSPPNTFTEMREEEVRIFFQEGNALFERNWPYAWALHKKAGLKFGVAPLPRLKRNASTLGGWHIGISKFSDEKEKSWKLLKFIVSYRIQKKLALKLGWNPGLKSIYEDPEILRKLPHFATLRNVFRNLVARPTIPYYTQISEVIQKYINAALAGRVTPEKALMKAEKEAQKIIERYE